MKLYDARTAPNPRRVRMFLAEKGMAAPTLVPVDIAAGEHLREPFRSVNPFGLLPALELDDGVVIVESVAICRYFEELRPDPPLFGVGAVGRAKVEMWNRLVEHEFFRHVANAFRHTHPAMRELEKPQLPQLAEVSRLRAQTFLETFDRELADRRYVAGDDFSIADITAIVAVDFMRVGRVPLSEGLRNVARWRESVSARPSALA